MALLPLSVYPTWSFRLQLYEQILAENEKLKAQLRDTELELSDLKLQLEKATQVRSCPECIFGETPCEIYDGKFGQMSSAFEVFYLFIFSFT